MMSILNTLFTFGYAQACLKCRAQQTLSQHMIGTFQTHTSTARITPFNRPEKTLYIQDRNEHVFLILVNTLSYLWLSLTFWAEIKSGFFVVFGATTYWAGYRLIFHDEIFLINCPYWMTRVVKQSWLIYTWTVCLVYVTLIQHMCTWRLSQSKWTCAHTHRK
jgi:hypothetical protein